MSEVFQFGHPDADQLNALMENALPMAEREQTLAHVAACADCRMVMALASGAEEDFPAPVVVPVVAEQPWWRLPVWIWSLPVVAGLAFFTVHREARVVAPVEDRQEAKVVRPAPLVVPVAPQAAVAAPKTIVRGENGGLALAGRDRGAVSEAKIPNVFTAFPDERLPKMSSTAQPQIAQPQIAIPQIARSATVGMVPAPSGDAPQARGLNAASGMTAGMAAGMGYAAVPAPPPAPAPSAAAPVVVNRSAMAGLGPARAAAAPVAAAPKAAPKTDVDANASATVITGAELDALASDEVSLPQVNRRAQTAAVVAHPLPGGLAAVSVTEGAGVTVALDGASHVFVTRDGGVHWAAAEAKWKGKAVRVGLEGAVEAGRVSMGLAAGSGAAANRVIPTQANESRAVPAGGSSVTGEVRDQTGAVIAGAAVFLKDGGGRLVRDAKTDDRGRFVMAGVVAGSYSLSATMPGFSEQVAKVTVLEGSQFNQNMKLAVGSENTLVEVMGTAQIETENATLAQTAKKRKVALVPVFELVTEKGVRWVSGDGVVWVKKK